MRGVLLELHLPRRSRLGCSSHAADKGKGCRSLADLASPWLVRYVAPEFALLQLAGWLVMTASAVVLIWVPLYEMWMKGRAR